jgi:CheY-like chemotaxis protein
MVGQRCAKPTVTALIKADDNALDQLQIHLCGIINLTRVSVELWGEPSQMKENAGLAERILIADDEELFLLPTAEFLRGEGYHCDCVRTADEAAEALARDSYDLLITDINMPGNRNLELLRYKTQGPGIIPVIVVTGYPSVHTAVESIRLSVVDYVVKPLEFKVFLTAVKSALEKGKAVRMMRKARQNLRDWLEQMKGMEEVLLSDESSAAHGQFAGTLDWYLGETVNRFANLSMNLMSAVQTLKKNYGGNRSDICSLMNCSRLAAHEQGLRETVEVLIKTKNAFKSKDLADLRKKLELLLKGQVSS